MEKKTTIRVPEAYVPLLEDIRLLQSDQHNPNRTTIKQQKQIWKSLQKYGWTYPIITNKDGVYADGEQRAEVCLKHNEFFAPVLRLPVSDLDAAEYVRIMKQGEKECLNALLRSVGEKPQHELFEQEFSVSIPATYEIIVECKDEVEQKRIFEKLKVEGYKLRILTL
jgi:hypothetical protein